MAVGNVVRVGTIKDFTPGINNKVIPPIAPGFHWSPVQAIIRMVTTATVGNRRLGIRVEDEVGDRIYELWGPVVQIQGTSIDYSAMPGAGRLEFANLNTPEVDSTRDIAFPQDMIVPDGASLRIYEVNNIDPLDTIEFAGTAAVIRS